MTADFRWIFCTRSRADDKIGEWLSILTVVYRIWHLVYVIVKKNPARLPWS